MPESPWISPYNIKPDFDKDYIAVVTYLPLTSYMYFPKFFKQVSKIQKQLQQTPGVIGFKLRADILIKKAYTMSVWEDAASLKNFITSGEHKKIMEETTTFLSEDRKFVTVFIKGAEFPPSWDWAMKMLKEN